MQQQLRQQQSSHSEKYLRQRKILLVLPLFVLPLMTFLLWLLGLIGDAEIQVQSAQSNAGRLNMSLPTPVPSKDSNWNKLNFYEQADKDAAKLAALLKNDPYYQPAIDEDREISDTFLLPVPSKQLAGRDDSRILHNSPTKLSYDGYPLTLNRLRDPNEEKVYNKLAELNAQLDKNTAQEQRKNKYAAVEHGERTISPPVNTQDIDRLENMMQLMQQTDPAANSDMQQVNEALGKILDIQHPERVKEKLKEKSVQFKEQAFPVTPINNEVAISLLQSGRQTIETVVSGKKDTSKKIVLPVNDFYSLEEKPGNVGEQSNSIEAVVHETQNLTSGGTLKLRLANDIYIGGWLIPKGNFVYGKVALNDGRLQTNVTSIQYQNQVLPVSLTLYGLDGLEGIPIKDAITTDAAKKTTDQAIRGLGIASLDQSFGAQAASAGIETAKSLLSKKVKLVKVTVGAGYRVLLHDDNQKSK